MAAVAILDYYFFEILTAWSLKRAELRRCAKLGRNPSKAAEIWRFFDFYKMAAVRHLIFVVCAQAAHVCVCRVVCTWRPWLRWEVGGVVARQAAGRNRRWCPMGAFSTASARRLRAFLHYSSSHNRATYNRAKRDCARLWLVAIKSYAAFARGQV